MPRKKLSLDDAKDIAKERMGECLSKKYVRSKDKLKWRCHYGHEWETSLASIRNLGSWCPKCNINIGEEITRNIMNILFDSKFTTQYPEWLEGLELDGYSEELSIAFEYDGIQHYKFVKHFHRTNQGFKEQLERDAKKDQLCGENGVILIRVPYTLKYEEIKNYICEQCKGMGLEVPNNVDIDHREFGHIYSNNALYDKLKVNVEEKGWTLISENYVSSTDRIIVRCNSEHEFETTPDRIKQNKQCYQCLKDSKGGIDRVNEIVSEYGIDCISDYDEYEHREAQLRFICDKGHKFKMQSKTLYNKYNKKHIIKCPICNTPKEKLKQFVSDHNGKCLDNYQDRFTSMKFQCDKGHKFQSTYASIKNGSWCHACKTGRKSISDMHEIAKKYGGKCLSKEYVNNQTKLKWKCKKGHIFWKKSNNIQSKDVFCSTCK